LARSEQGRRSFSFALLCCVHQRTGAALIKKKKEKRSRLLAWAATLPGRHKKRVRESRFFFPAGACGAMRTGGGVFSSPAWPGRCKGEEGGARRSAAALFAGAQEEENKTNLLR